MPASQRTRSGGKIGTLLRDCAGQAPRDGKLDTQGSELDILGAGQEMLAACLGLELEVEFNAMYTGQPLFHEVDRFLRGLGFTLWRTIF